MPLLARTTIGVIGSGTDEHSDLAEEVGTLLAELGVNLLTGGGGGVMTAVSRAFTRSPRTSGICIGIIPCESESDRRTPKPGYPNAFIELPIFTHLPHSGSLGKHELSRNHINVLSCRALVALPGGAGTLSEVELALQYGRKVVIFARDNDPAGRFPPQVRRIFDRSELRAFLTSTFQ